MDELSMYEQKLLQQSVIACSKVIAQLMMEVQSFLEQKPKTPSKIQSLETIVQDL
jgi:hypothetical protein